MTLGTDGTGVSLIGAGAEMGAGVKAGAVGSGAAVDAAGFDAWNRPLLGALVAGCEKAAKGFCAGFSACPGVSIAGAAASVACSFFEASAEVDSISDLHLLESSNSCGFHAVLRYTYLSLSKIPLFLAGAVAGTDWSDLEIGVAVGAAFGV